MTESTARRLLAAPPNGDFVAALRAVLGTCRRSGWLTITQAAELAGMSVRTLQRRLAADGLTFSLLLDEARLQLAVDLVQNTDMALDEIANEAGYTKLSNFSRAFQRWTGKTPIEFGRGRRPPGETRQKSVESSVMR